MKPEDFAHASASFKRLNSYLFVEGAGQAPELECAAEHAALHPREAEEPDSGKFLVRVVSVRQRLLDEDNLAEKFHVDCLRYAGVLPSDDPATTRIETTQRKALKGEAPHTLIEVFRLPKSP